MRSFQHNVYAAINLNSTPVLWQLEYDYVIFWQTYCETFLQLKCVFILKTAVAHDASCSCVHPHQHVDVFNTFFWLRKNTMNWSPGVCDVTMGGGRRFEDGVINALSRVQERMWWWLWHLICISTLNKSWWVIALKSVKRLRVSTPVVLYRYHELLGMPLRWIQVYIVAQL